MNTRKLINKGIWSLIGFLGFNAVTTGCGDDEQEFEPNISTGRPVAPIAPTDTTSQPSAPADTTNQNQNEDPEAADTTGKVPGLLPDSIFFPDVDTSMMCMYGVPMAEYIFKGKITDIHGLPIEKAQIEIFDCANQPAIIMTDNNGEYSYSQKGMTLCDIKISASADKYASKDTTISYEDMKFENGTGAWNHGTSTNIVDLTLKPKRGSR